MTANGQRNSPDPSDTQSSGKPVSIRDIAEMAGVSTATVSRVINNNGRFSEATRERVQRIIDETGYVTNMAAKSLRESRSKTIGMIVPDISNDFFSTLALHTERYLAKRGYSVFVCNNANDPERERDYIKTLVSKQVDGIICISGAHDFEENLSSRSIPVVCVDRYPGEDSPIPRVRSADDEGGTIVAEHLLERGCHNIVLMTSAIEEANKIDRQQGFERTLGKHGIELSANERLYLTRSKPSIVESEILMNGFIESERPVDAVFTLSDHSAAGVLRSLRSHGIRVPADVKLVGYDNSIYSQLTTPSITTIERYPEQLANTGCDLLLKMIKGEQVPSETVVPVKLVERESTALA